MSNQNRSQLAELMSHVEELWGHLETLFEDLNATDGWGSKHGPDWTFADVPYHLAYCNRDIVIRGLEAGIDMPQDEQELLASREEVNAWNARKFAERPPGQTAAQSVVQWRKTCDRIRSYTAKMSDPDLESPFWMPLYLGWTTASQGLEFTRAHDWSEFTQLRIHMGRDEPVPSADITRDYLGRMLGFMPMFINTEAAADQEFAAVYAFTDPGVGAFTMRVENGSAELVSGADPEPDLVMTQSATTYEKTLQGIVDPAEAIHSGLIQVNNFESLATFGQLFRMP
jgi:hypothetical protein